MAAADIVYAGYGVASVAVDIIYDANGVATQAGGGAHDIIYKANGVATVAAALTVTLGNDVTGIEPYEIVTLTATCNDGGATLTIVQSLGPAAVLINGTGPTWTYEAPPELDYDGSHLRFTVTATPISGTPVSAEVDHFVYPNCFGYVNRLGQLVPMKVSRPSE